ncbi:acyltransferase family protein [Variovorax sp. LT2P21]|uniref:acyltransferase family protein n=1 Tax=Variovorax sp. LT2P21 TaxID=3443731 RepID=UPI003F4501EB
MTRSFGLDLARVAAIAFVLLSHFAHKLEFVGVFGVELFFALSGYLIGGVLYRSLLTTPRWSFHDVRVFWVRRWYRTVPNYLFFLVVALFFHAYFGGLPTARHLAAHLVFMQNMMSGDNAFYGVSWSLAVEEWFYLTFPLVILAFTAAGLHKRAAFVATTVVFIVVPAALRELVLMHSPAESVRLMTLPRLDAIFYGVGAAFLVARRPMGGSARLACMLVGSVLSLTLFVLHALDMDGVGVYRATFLLAPTSFALMLPWLQRLAVPTGRLVFVRASITNLSLWSYSIYLSHIPVLFVVYALFGSSRVSTAVNVLSKLVGLAACLILSRFIFLHFEKRLTDMRPSERRLRLPVGSRSAI